MNTILTKNNKKCQKCKVLRQEYPEYIYIKCNQCANIDNKLI